MFSTPIALFSVQGIVYGLLLPLLVLQIIALLLIPALLTRGGSADAAGKAIYAYLMQAIGILLMTVGGLPALHSVLSGQDYPSTTYLALLIVFASGGLTFLWHDHLAHTIDGASRAVPEAIYFYTFKLLGFLAALLAAMSLLLTMLLNPESPENWWVMPVIILTYGLLLSWCTRTENGSLLQKFQSSPLAMPPSFPRPVPAKAPGKVLPQRKKQR